MKRFLIVLAMSGSMSACATASEPRVVVKEVRVPVAVPCRAKIPPPPQYAADTVPLDASIFDKAKALLADREQRKAREVELEAAARACS